MKNQKNKASDAHAIVPVAPCDRDDCLQKKISLFESATENIPSQNISVNAFLLGCKRGKYQELIEELRGETDKEKKNSLKMQLPAVTIQSEPCEKHGKDYCKNNDLICLDFDDVDDVEEAKLKIITVPYVLTALTSAGEKGVFAVCVLSQPATNLKPILEMMQYDFEYPIDKKCSDVSRLRFVTYDPEPAVRDSIMPFVLANNTNKSSNIAYNAEHAIDRAKAYIAKMPPAISGQCGHDAALNVVNALHDFGLTEDEAYCVFKENYNFRCQPEWSDDEIRHKIREAFDKPLHEHGCKLHESKTKNKLSKADVVQQSLEHFKNYYTVYPACLA